MEERNQSKGRKIWFLSECFITDTTDASYGLVHTMCHHSMIGRNVLNVHLGATLHVLQMIRLMLLLRIIVMYMLFEHLC